MLPLFTALALSLATQPQDPASRAQDASPFTQPADAALLARAAAAVRAWDGKDLYLVGEISTAAPQPAGGGAVFIQGGPGGDAKPFQGNVEIVLTAKKELCVASLLSLPEVVIYDDGTRRLVRTTVAEKAVDTEHLTTDLASALDLGKLAAQIEKSAKAAATEPASDGSRSIECELSPRLIAQVAASGHGGGRMAMFGPKVLGVAARLDLDANGALAGLELSVRRSDPMARLHADALREAGSGGGVVTRALSMNADDMDSDEPGAESTYRLRPSVAEPTLHLRESLAALRKLAEGKR